MTARRRLPVFTIPNVVAHVPKLHECIDLVRIRSWDPKVLYAEFPCFVSKDIEDYDMSKDDVNETEAAFRGAVADALASWEGDVHSWDVTFRRTEESEDGDFRGAIEYAVKS